MWQVARRLLIALGVMWGAITATFLAMRVIPGNPVDMIVSGSNASPAIVAQIRADLGLNRPIPVQYADYLLGVLHGNLGESYQLGQPVTRILIGNIGPTVELALSACAIMLVLAFVLAVTTAGRPGATRAVLSVLELATVAMPSYFTGLILLTIFSFRLGWFPVVSTSGISSLVLPAVTLALVSLGIFAQLLRDGLEDALRRPFALTARSRGLSRLRVNVVHGIRPALSPVLTMAGTLAGHLIAGAVLVENVFGRPGLGEVTLQAVRDRDMPVVMGVVLLSAAVFAVLSGVIDLSQRALDPRLRAHRLRKAPSPAPDLRTVL